MGQSGSERLANQRARLPLGRGSASFRQPSCRESLIDLDVARPPAMLSAGADDDEIRGTRRRLVPCTDPLIDSPQLDAPIDLPDHDAGCRSGCAPNPSATSLGPPPRSGRRVNARNRRPNMFPHVEYARPHALLACPAGSSHACPRCCHASCSRRPQPPLHPFAHRGHLVRLNGLCSILVCTLSHDSCPFVLCTERRCMSLTSDGTCNAMMCRALGALSRRRKRWLGRAADGRQSSMMR